MVIPKAQQGPPSKGGGPSCACSTGKDDPNAPITHADFPGPRLYVKQSRRSGGHYTPNDAGLFRATRLALARSGSPHRVEYLSARQTLTLTQELRAALTELAEGLTTRTIR
jgi:hypothetical protein